MCEPLTLGLALAGVGTGTQAVNNYTALRRQDQEAARGIRTQAQIQKQANNRVNENIEDLAASTGDAERAESLEGFRNALRAARDESVGGLPDVPGASNRFAEAVSQGRAQVAADADARAGRLSRIDAPIFQRMNEGADRGRTALDLSGLQRRSSAEDFINRLRISERRPNPWIDALGSVLKGAGSAVTLGADGGILQALRGSDNLTRLAKSGTLIDAPVNPYVSAVRSIYNA